MTAPIVHPGDIAEGPVRRSSSQAGLAAVKYGPQITSGGAVTPSSPVPPEAPTPSTTPDHGPLAATLSDRTKAKVLSRPAHVPSIVLLDRDAAAQVLANAVADLLNDGKNWHDIAARNKVRAALADYRATVQS